MNKRTLCRFGWHDWNKWEFDCDMKETHLPYGVALEGIKGATRDVTRMKRTCIQCGKLQYDYLP